MSTNIDPSNVKAVECRFAVYCPPQDGGRDDYHLVKEIIHTNDGQVIPNIRYLKNYQRPFWVTKKGFRKHTSKKEWEDVSRVTEYKSTQTRLIEKASMALEMPYFRGNLRRLNRSPYLYGTDILSTAIIKKIYQDKFPDTVTPYTIACYDTETDVLHGTNEIRIATLSYKDKVFTAVEKSFVAGYSDVVNRLHALLDKYMGEVIKRRGIKWEVVICEDEADVVKKLFAKAHEWRPDFLAIWNMNFDIPKTVEALKRANIDPADVFSDPSVPKGFRFFSYKEGPAQKVTASGKVTPIKPAARWHTVFCPSSFYVIDAMCAYRHIRTGMQEEPSYSLDAILKKHKVGSKLKFEEADGYVGLGWHQKMQRDHPLEYIIYNVNDSVEMEELDDKTKDLSIQLPMMSGFSDFENFKSQPRRVVDQLHFFVQTQKNKVIGSTSDEMSEDLDEMTVGLKDWI